MKKTRGRYLHYFSTCLILVGILVISGSCTFASNGLLKVTFLDVGQGDSILIRTPGGKNILIDGSDDRGDYAQKVILPFLRQNGITQLDQVILTHAHRDHIGGLLFILDNIKVNEVIESKESRTQMYLDFLKIAKKNNIKLTKAYRGDILDWGAGVKAEVLHPPKGFILENPFAKEEEEENAGKNSEGSLEAGDPNLNEYSIAIKLDYNRVSYYLAGDCEREAEKSILSAFPESRLRCTIYKASHHGSNTSSTPALLSKLKPEIAVISVGEGNSFGHPHKETLNNLNHYCKNVYRTDKDRTVDTWTDGETYHLSTGATPNELLSGPEVINITATGATIVWSTSQLSTSTVNYGVNSISENQVTSTCDYEMLHTVSLSNLKPMTAYRFQIFSRAKRDPDHVITKEGTFRTSAAPAEQVSITKIDFNPPQAVLLEPVLISATITREAPPSLSLAGLRASFYFDSVAPSKFIGSVELPDNSSATASIKWTPPESRNTNIFVVVDKDGTVTGQSFRTMQVIRKKVIIDAAHRNFLLGDLENMAVDLSNRGFEVFTSEAPITDSLLSGANVLILPEPGTGPVDLTSSELTAIKNFTDKGGGVLIISRCDFGNRQNSEGVNRLLKKLGANIRVNDDEVKDETNNVGVPWIINVTTFPSPVIKDVSVLLYQAGASLLDANMRPLKASERIQLFATGDNDTYNIDSDGMGDAVIYPPDVPVVLDAGEILPRGGKVAVFGAGHVSANLYYYTSKHQTPVFNACVIRWLATKATKKSSELIDDLRELGMVENHERAFEQVTRYEDSKKELIRRLHPGDKNFSKNLNNLIDSLTDPSTRTQLLPVAKETLDYLRFLTLQNPDLMKRFSRQLRLLEKALEGAE